MDTKAVVTERELRVGSVSSEEDSEPEVGVPWLLPGRMGITRV